MKAAFLIIARDKEKFVEKAVMGALAQTYPCEILLSDQSSTDRTLEIMESIAENWQAQVGETSQHKLRVLKCPVPGPYGMRACNEHFMWLARQTEAEWLFLCSADDYSLPDRVKVCMKAVESFNCSIVATTMHFAHPDKEPHGISGYPPKTGYVEAGDGLWKMAYGGTVQGYKRSFLLKAGSAEDSTADVFYGYLAALDEGYYVVCDPQHVHVQHAALDNMGFQGKMLAAQPGSDEHWRLNELNRFQLLDLYYSTAVRAQELYPLAHQKDRDMLLQMVFAQAQGWLESRKELHKRKITPGVL